MKKHTKNGTLFFIPILMMILVLCTSCSSEDLDAEATEASTEEESESYSVSLDEEPESVSEEYSETTTEDYTEPSTEEEIFSNEVDESTEIAEADTEDDISDENDYSFTELSAVMYASSGLNVRDLPDKSGRSLGKLIDNEELSVTGQCNETGWYRIDYSGDVGYVSNDFVSTEKKEAAVEENAVTDTTVADTAAAGAVAATTGVATGVSEGSGSGNGSNFDTYDNPEQQQTSASYVLNTNTGKFHKPSCSSVAKIAPQNYATANDRDSIIAQGYVPCKKCNP